MQADNYPRNYWTRGPIEQDGQHVYYLAPDRTTMTRVIDDLEKPNGIIGTSDGMTLYVADSDANKTYAYDIQPGSSLMNKRLFCVSAPTATTGNLLTLIGTWLPNEGAFTKVNLTIPTPFDSA